MMMEMSDEVERLIKIINSVKARECLWNVQNKEYAKRTKTESAWLEVAKEIGRSDNYCREKWRNVRTGFIRSLHYKQCPASEEHNSSNTLVSRKRFYLHEFMKFLLPSLEKLKHTKKRKRHYDEEKDYASIYTEDSAPLDEYAALVEYYEEPTNLTDKQQYKTYSLRRAFEAVRDNSGTYEEILKKVEQPEPTTDVHNKPHNTRSMTKKTDVNDDVQKPPQTIIKTISPIEHLITLKKSFDNEQPNNLQKNEVEQSDNPHLESILNKSQSNSPQVIQSDDMKKQDTYERAETQLMTFFRGSVDDILSLSKSSQRLFKRKMLELIEELHEAERKSLK